MREFDERVKLPKFLRNVLMFTFGISGLSLMFRGSYEADYTDSILFLAGGVFSAFALWGLVCLLEDVRDSKTWGELWDKIYSKFIDNR